MTPSEIVHLPCARCGARAATLRIDRHPADMDMLMSVLGALRSAARLGGMFGSAFKLPRFDETRHPLLQVEPRVIAEAVGLTCLECIEDSCRYPEPALRLEPSGAADASR